MHPLQSGQLALNLIWGQKIVGIQPLDVVPFTELQGMVTGCCSTTVFNGDDRELLGGESAR